MRRRAFIAAAAAASGGLIVLLRQEREAPIPGGPPSSAPFAPNAFLRLDADGLLLLRTGQTELGQGVHTALALIAAHELDQPLARIRVETASDDPAYANPLMGRQRTAWSASVRAWWTPLRRAAAQARAMLVDEAAARWQVEPRACTTRDGAVLHPDGRQCLAYAALADAAGRRAPPRRPVLKPDTEWEPPTEARRLDGAPKVTGRAAYAADVRADDMLSAAVVRAPIPGLRPRAVSDERTRALEGVTAVVPFAGGVAVLADTTWTARRGAALLDVTWPATPASPRDAMPAPPAPPDDCAITLAVTTAPLLHAAIEPQSCTARWSSERCEIWTGTQDQTTARERAAAAAGLPPERIDLHTTFAGGAFGRGVDPRVVEEAVTLARAVPGRAVRLQYAREEDFALDVVRGPTAHSLGATLDDRGRLTRWRHLMHASESGGAIEAMPYRVRDRKIGAKAVPLPLAEGLWRAVDGGPACFAIESLIDAAARAANADPLAFRLAHLDDPRARGVLDALREAAWTTALPAGMARGCALHQQTGSWCAVAAEATLRGTTPTVTRLVAVVDGGRIVHPDGARAQVEGALLMGLGAALRERTAATDLGLPAVRTLAEYPVLRVDEAPALEIRFAGDGSVPHGLGEVALPPVAPAVASAFAQLTGRPFTSLPLLAAS
jgi:isoquinoline 1-oxidoreductase beta subunit